MFKKYPIRIKIEIKNQWVKMSAFLIIKNNSIYTVYYKKDKEMVNRYHYNALNERAIFLGFPL